MRKYNTFNGCEEANLKNWTLEIASHLTTLSWSQAFGLALWSFGLVLADRSGISSVVAALAQHLSLQEGNLRQQLREWLWSAGAKKGQCRREVEVTSCFKPLLSWVVSRWPSSVKQVVLALDASTLFDRFTVLAIKVVYRGTAIPVAWKIKPSKTKGAWKTYWLELLEALRGGIPADRQVLVTGDQGLYGDWLFHKITSLGWHPFLRIKADGYFRLRGQNKWREISRLPRPGGMWSRAVVCFKEHPLECTLLSWWEASYREGWLIVTDLPVKVARASWYSYRSWIERGFRQNKRGGWHWEQSRHQDASRAERVWLTFAVATLWTSGIGGEAEEDLAVKPPLKQIEVGQSEGGQAPPRRLGCFMRGVLVLRDYLGSRRPYPPLQFIPEERQEKGQCQPYFFRGRGSASG